jgi:hypothetical protein
MGGAADLHAHALHSLDTQQTGRKQMHMHIVRELKKKKKFFCEEALHVTDTAESSRKQYQPSFLSSVGV